jgi:uncharacterized protein YneF (UPF0154 family)
VNASPELPGLSSALRPIDPILNKTVINMTESSIPGPIRDLLYALGTGVNNKIFALTENQLMLLISGAIIFGFAIGIIIGWWRGSKPITKKAKAKWERTVNAEKMRQMVRDMGEREKRIDEVIKGSGK